MPRPFTKITDWRFVDADTGEVREEFKMREFYAWDKDRCGGAGYVLVRHYQLSLEHILNPNREGLECPV